MLSSSSEEVVKQLTALCKNISAVILPYYGQSEQLNIQTKSNNTPLTAADLAAHHLLAKQLPTIIDLPVISEEADYTLGEHSLDDYWLIDPIDGTREFINKTDEFCIIITRITHHRPTLAYLYAPTQDAAWFAFADQGAYSLSGDSSHHTRIQCRSVSEPIHIIAPRITFNHRMKTFISECFKEYHCTRIGSALKFCAIAEGQADIYFKLTRKTCEWDIAAGDLLLCEAGGGLCLLDGTQPQYGLKNDPTNPPFLAYGAGFEKEQIQQILSIMQAQINQTSSD